MNSMSSRAKRAAVSNTRLFILPPFPMSHPVQARYRSNQRLPRALRTFLKREELSYNALAQLSGVHHDSVKKIATEQLKRWVPKTEGKLLRAMQAYRLHKEAKAHYEAKKNEINPFTITPQMRRADKARIHKIPVRRERKSIIGPLLAALSLVILASIGTRALIEPGTCQCVRQRGSSFATCLCRSSETAYGSSRISEESIEERLDRSTPSSEIVPRYDSTLPTAPSAPFGESHGVTSSESESGFGSQSF